MQIPRRFNTHCPHCNEHTEHEIEKVRSGRPSGMTKGARMQKKRAGIGNEGKNSKVPAGQKPTQKADLRYRCNECGRAHLREGWRAGRLEFQD